MIGSPISTQPAQSRDTPYDSFSGHFFNSLFFAFYFVPIFDLMHAVDTIFIPLKQLRASQNRL